LRREGPTEILDELDCMGKRTGKVIARDDAHQNGIWHGAFHCLIVYERDNRGFALFQKRSAQKKIAPGKFDVSVGGHYAHSEDARTAGPREIKEELGLEVRYSELFPIGRRIFVYCFTPGVREHELQDVFLLPGTIPVAELTLQREEVEGVLELEVEEGLKLFSLKTGNAAGMFSAGNAAPGRVIVSAGDFVPCLDNYYLKLLLLARRYLNNERELLLI
jgi:isopentenyldiphosphate isomerase